jgi:hypothetical protein
MKHSKQLPFPFSPPHPRNKERAEALAAALPAGVASVVDWADLQAGKVRGQSKDCCSEQWVQHRVGVQSSTVQCGVVQYSAGVDDRVLGHQ